MVGVVAWDMGELDKTSASHVGSVRGLHDCLESLGKELILLRQSEHPVANGVADDFGARVDAEIHKVIQYRKRAR